MTVVGADPVRARRQAKKKLPQMRAQFMSSIFSLTRNTSRAVLVGYMSLDGTFMSPSSTKAVAQSLRMLMARARAQWLVLPDKTATEEQIEAAVGELSEWYGVTGRMVELGNIRTIMSTLVSSHMRH
jgi:hypothetical protein